ncbi:MAG: Plasmid maintenance system antidote protein [Rhizobium sp.]|nr:Plasmid maintenance system antidote protein [Rhizobium sp.]
MIDSEWFYRQLERDGRSLRDMAKGLGLDPSAVSRMLRGERKMSAEEQDGIAEYLGISINEVAMRRRGEAIGFGEQAQEALNMDVGRAAVSRKREEPTQSEPDASVDERSFLERIRERMAGSVTIPPGVDVTEPADPEWGKVYDEEGPVSF